jgi:hypothetical protein
LIITAIQAEVGHHFDRKIRTFSATEYRLELSGFCGTVGNKKGLPDKGSPFVVEFTGRESMCGDTVWTPINLPVKSALAIGV